MAYGSVIEIVQKFLLILEEHGINKPFAVLYGSQATGETHPWSDIDLLIVSESYDSSLTRQHIADLWKLASKVDNRIEPVPCGLYQWQNDDSSALIETARLTGKTIKAA